jgi:hypothetical protein
LNWSPLAGFQVILEEDDDPEYGTGTPDDSGSFGRDL